MAKLPLIVWTIGLFQHDMAPKFIKVFQGTASALYYFLLILTYIVGQGERLWPHVGVCPRFPGHAQEAETIPQNSNTAAHIKKLREKVKSIKRGRGIRLDSIILYWTLCSRLLLQRGTGFHGLEIEALSAELWLPFPKVKGPLRQVDCSNMLPALLHKISTKGQLSTDAGLGRTGSMVTDLIWKLAALKTFQQAVWTYAV